MAIPAAGLAGAAGQLKGALAGASGIMPQGMTMAPGLGLATAGAAAPSSLAINAPPAAYSGTGGASGTSGGNYGSSGAGAAPAPSAPAVGGALSGAAAGSAAPIGGSSGGTTQVAQNSGSFNISPFSNAYTDSTGGANAGVIRNVDLSPVGGLPYSAPGFTGGGMGLIVPRVTATATQNLAPPTPIAEANSMMPSFLQGGNASQNVMPITREPQNLAIGIPANPLGSGELGPSGLRSPGFELSGLQQAPVPAPQHDPRFYSSPANELPHPRGGLPYSTPGFLDRGPSYAPQPEFKMPTVTATPTPAAPPAPTPIAESPGTYHVPGYAEQSPTSGLARPYSAPGFLDRGNANMLPPVAQAPPMPNAQPFGSNPPRPGGAFAAPPDPNDYGEIKPPGGGYPKPASGASPSTPAPAQTPSIHQPYSMPSWLAGGGASKAPAPAPAPAPADIFANPFTERGNFPPLVRPSSNFDTFTPYDSPTMPPPGGIPSYGAPRPPKYRPTQMWDPDRGGGINPFVGIGHR